MVRTSPFQGGNTGSNPVWSTKQLLPSKCCNFVFHKFSASFVEAFFINKKQPFRYKYYGRRIIKILHGIYKGVEKMLRLHTVENYKPESLFETTRNAILGAITSGMDSHTFHKSYVRPRRDTFSPKGLLNIGRSNDACHTSKNIEFQVLEATETEAISISAVQEFAISASVDAMLGYGCHDPAGQMFTYSIDLQIAVPYDGEIFTARLYCNDVSAADDNRDCSARWILTNSHVNVAAIRNQQNVWVLYEYLQKLIPEVMMSKDVMGNLRRYRRTLQTTRY